MANIRPRLGKSGRTTYQVRVRTSGANQQTKTFKKLTEARARAAKREDAVREGVKFPERRSRRRTLGALIAKSKVKSRGEDALIAIFKYRTVSILRDWLTSAACSP